MPHRAHVLRRRSHRLYAADDSRLRRSAASHSIEETAAFSEERLRWHLQGHEWTPGDDPSIGSAIA